MPTHHTAARLGFMAHSVVLSLLLTAWASCSGETFWDGFAYTPPIPMFGGDQAGNAGLPISGWEFRSEGGSNGYAQVTFQFMSVLAILPRPSELPTNPIVTLADLKHFIDSQPSAKQAASHLTSRIVKLDGRDALAIPMKPAAGPVKVGQTLWLVWRTNRVWLKNELFSISVCAENPVTFQKLVQSLATVKLPSSSPAPVTFTRGVPLLGMSHEEVRARCGKFFASGVHEELYAAANSLLEVSFDDHDDDRVGYICYYKVKDPKQAAAAIQNDDPQARFKDGLPWTAAEIQALLRQHSEGGKLKWTPTKAGRWQRSDGAMAAHQTSYMILASRKMSPQLTIFSQ